MTLRVGLSRDLLNSTGQFGFGQRHIEVLDAARDLLCWEMLPDGPLTPEVTDSFDAQYVNTPAVPASAVAGAHRLKIVARHGVGYDSVPVDALTGAGVLQTNTPAAVRRPVATMALTFILALAQRVVEKDRMTREGRWHERQDCMGMGLTGWTLGSVGAGSIGREIAVLAAQFGMRVLAADPYMGVNVPQGVGIEAVGLGPLIEQSGLRRRRMPADRGDPSPDRQVVAGAHETARLSRQRCPRRYRRRGRADRGAARRVNRRGRAGRVRAGAGGSREPVAGHAERHRHAPCPVLDRRVLRRDCQDGDGEHRRCTLAPGAGAHRQPRRA